MSGRRQGLEPRTQSSQPSQAERQRDAKAYWDGLTPAQETWVLRKMRFSQMGRQSGTWQVTLADGSARARRT